jgi:GrpB-like predicted nucleotidyltransferase (UPF0157 family)
MKKYVFKPYNPIFPELFHQEQIRIASSIQSILAIEHVGSTAVSNLGGKGIIDIAIAANRKDWELVSEQLQKLGYEFRPNFSTADRIYFVIFLPDPEEGTRRYHVHLTDLESSDWKGLIGFRDYLRTHREQREEYATIKKQAALESHENGELYRKLKEPIFKQFELYCKNL